MNIWRIPRKELRIVRFDPHVAVRVPFPTDAEWLRRWAERVARNIQRRIEKRTALYGEGT